MEHRPQEELRHEPDTRKETRIAFFSTILIHVLLLALFFFINVGWQYRPSAWVEMDFIAVKSRPARSKRPAVRPAIQKNRAVKQKQKKIHLVLPKRNLTDEEEQLIQRDRRDLANQDETSAPLRATDNIQRQELNPLQQSELASEKQAADLGTIQTGEKRIDFRDVDLGKGVTVPFKIEGDVAERAVLYKVLPQYPGGLRSEAVVKLRFAVLPSGIVVNIVPVHKGEATLERAAISAFQQWRFNPLTGQSAHSRQNGMITFRFVLQEFPGKFDCPPLCLTQIVS